MSKEVPPKKRPGRPPDPEKAGATFGLRRQYDEARAQPGNENLSLTGFAMAVAVTQCVDADERDALIQSVWKDAPRGAWTRKRLRMAIGRAPGDAMRKERRLLEFVKSRFDTLMQDLKAGNEANRLALEQRKQELRAQAKDMAAAPCSCGHHHCRNRISSSHYFYCDFVAPEGEVLTVRCWNNDRHDMASETCHCDHHHCAECGAAVRASSKAFLHLEVSTSPLLEEARVPRWICGYCRDEKFFKPG